MCYHHFLTCKHAVNWWILCCRESTCVVHTACWIRQPYSTLYLLILHPLQSEIDYTRDIRSIASFESDMPVERADANSLTMSQFFAKHSVALFLASTTWFIFNLVFSGLLILIDQPTMVIGFTKGTKRVVSNRMSYPSHFLLPVGCTSSLPQWHGLCLIPIPSHHKPLVSMHTHF